MAIPARPRGHLRVWIPGHGRTREPASASDSGVHTVSSATRGCFLLLGSAPAAPKPSKGHLRAPECSEQKGWTSRTCRQNSWARAAPDTGPRSAQERDLPVPEKSSTKEEKKKQQPRTAYSHGCSWPTVSLGPLRESAPTLLEAWASSHK